MQLISTPKIITFLLELLLPDNENLPLVSNPIPFSEYLHLSGYPFLVNVASPNKEFPNVNLVAGEYVHKSSS